MTQSDAGSITVGLIRGAHGIRGQLRVQSFTEQPEDIFDYHPWQIVRSAHLAGDAGERAANDAALLGRMVRVLDYRPADKGYLVQLQGIDDRDTALALTGCEIQVPVDSLPELAAGEYYWKDLAGLSVVTHEGLRLGQVVRMMETGANDVLVVQGDADAVDRAERLIPWLPDQVIEEVSLEKRCIRVRWQPDY